MTLQAEWDSTPEVSYDAELIAEWSEKASSQSTSGLGNGCYVNKYPSTCLGEVARHYPELFSWPSSRSLIRLGLCLPDEDRLVSSGYPGSRPQTRAHAHRDTGMCRTGASLGGAARQPLTPFASTAAGRDKRGLVGGRTVAEVDSPAPKIRTRTMEKPISKNRATKNPRERSALLQRAVVETEWRLELENAALLVTKNALNDRIAYIESFFLPLLKARLEGLLPVLLPLPLPSEEYGSLPEASAGEVPDGDAIATQRGAFGEKRITAKCGP